MARVAICALLHEKRKAGRSAQLRLLTRRCRPRFPYRDRSLAAVPAEVSEITSSFGATFLFAARVFPRKLAGSRRCGEMADATDLKSVFAKAKCGFESRHRHPLKRDFTRDKWHTTRFRQLRINTHENAENRNLFESTICQPRLRLHLFICRLQSTTSAKQPQ